MTSKVEVVLSKPVGAQGISSPPEHVVIISDEPLVAQAITNNVDLALESIADTVQRCPDAKGYAWEEAGAAVFVRPRSDPLRLDVLTKWLKPAGLVIPAIAHAFALPHSMRARSAYIDHFTIIEAKWVFVHVHPSAGADQFFLCDEVRATPGAPARRALVLVQYRTGEADLVDSLRSVDPAWQFTTETQRSILMGKKAWVEATMAKSSARVAFEKAYAMIRPDVVFRVIASAGGFSSNAIKAVNALNAVFPTSPILLLESKPGEDGMGVAHAAIAPRAPKLGAPALPNIAQHLPLVVLQADVDVLRRGRKGALTGQDAATLARWNAHAPVATAVAAAARAAAAAAAKARKKGKK
jgi:hypothetical protein